MTDNALRELYQEVILDHSRHPRHYGSLDHASHKAEGYNPLCGDKVTVYLKLDADGRVGDIKFEGKGCGYEHLIWQHILSGHFKERKAVIELNRGNKCIDVAFENEGRLIAMEVAITSAHEKENIEKNINLAKAGIVIVRVAIIAAFADI